MPTPPRAPVRDWSAYNRAVIERGSLTVWVDADALTNWSGASDPRRIGRPFVHGDAAIQLVLTLREMYRLPLRAAQGFTASIFAALGVALPVPHYATLSRRSGAVPIDLGATPAAGPRVLVLGRTGLKVFGEGEWKVRKHGYSQRRTWRKLHLAIDARTQEIVACETTECGATDASQVGPLLDAVEEDVSHLTADGAHDQAAVHEAARARGAVPVVPPRRGAKVRRHGNRSGPRLARDENIRGVRRHGRRGWKRRVRYHERSLAETGMFRLKNNLGERLRGRKLETQRTENRVKCRVLNRMTRLGMLSRKV
jgi:Transposase DDE domain